MRSPRDFLKPLALGAPDPVREIPIKPSRMIHFFDPSNEKMAAKLPELAKQADILLGNLEDAIAADKKIAARDGLVRIGREVDLGDDAALDARQQPRLAVVPRRHHDARRRHRQPPRASSWCPKVEGPWDIHYVDRLLAQLEAKHKVQRPILVHAHPRDRARRDQRRGDLRGEPAHAGRELRPGRPRGVAPHEDDARRRRASGVPRAQRSRPAEPERAAPDRAAGPVALLDRAHGRRLRRDRLPAVLRPVRRHRATRSAARTSSAPRSCSAASAPGRCTRARSRSRRRSSARRVDEVLFAKKVLEAMPDGRGVHMIDGKMQDDATWKQCKVMVTLAELLARKDPELKQAYGL